MPEEVDVQPESSPGEGVTPAPPPAPAPTPPPPAAVAPKPEPPKDDPEPVLEKKADGSRWKDYDEYREAWKGWAFREGGRRELATYTENQQKAAEARVQAQWKQRWEATAQDPEYPDYAKVAFNKDVFINKVTEGFLYTSEQAEQFNQQQQAAQTAAGPGISQPQTQPAGSTAQPPQA